MTKFIDHETHGRKTVCICPKCRRKHTVKMRWIGRGIVWKFCRPCKNECDNYEHIDDSGNAPWYAIRRTTALS